MRVAVQRFADKPSTGRQTLRSQSGSIPNLMPYGLRVFAAPSSQPKSQPVFLRQRSAIFDRIVTARPTQPR